FSWEEVECRGACANAPMAQSGQDYYEDLTADKLRSLMDERAAGNVPVRGPQNGRYAAVPAGGLTSLKATAEGRAPLNASAALAAWLQDTLKRIDGTEVPLITPWLGQGQDGAGQDAARDDMMPASGANDDEPTPGPKPAEGLPVDEPGITVQEATEIEAGRPDTGSAAPEQEIGRAHV